jgi:hypothetical protein
MRPYVAVSDKRREVPWLAHALERLSENDPITAYESLFALLPAQAQALGRTLCYDLTVRGRGVHRVTLRGEDGVVGLPSRGSGNADATVVGDLDALIPLAAGGAQRRIPGVDVAGSRRRLRKLIRARRRPVGLPELREAGVTLPGGLLLALLLSSVSDVSINRKLIVDYQLGGDEDTVWRVSAAQLEGLRVMKRPEGAGPADATVYISETALSALLGALPLPPGERLLVSGNSKAVDTLHGWFAIAQGLPPGALVSAGPAAQAV